MLLIFLIEPGFESIKKLTEFFEYLGLGSSLILCEPDFQARAFDPEPKLIPPLSLAKR